MDLELRYVFNLQIPFTTNETNGKFNIQVLLAIALSAMKRQIKRQSYQDAFVILNDKNKRPQEPQFILFVGVSAIGLATFYQQHKMQYKLFYYKRLHEVNPLFFFSRAILKCGKPLFFSPFWKSVYLILRALA